MTQAVHDNALLPENIEGYKVPFFLTGQ